MHTQIQFLGFGPGQGPGRGPNIMRQLVVIFGCYVVAKMGINRPRGDSPNLRLITHDSLHESDRIYAYANKKMCSIYIPTPI